MDTVRVACIGQETNYIQYLVREIRRSEGIPSCFYPLPYNFTDSDIRSLLSKAKEDGFFDLVVSLGGDGTLVSVAKECAFFNVPVVGVNCGHLGFLCEFTSNEIDDLIALIRSEDKKFIDRYIISGATESRAECYQVGAFNDIVVQSTDSMKAIEIDVKINDTPLYSFTGSGLLVASPTGSTGFNLSAGGPILSPDLENMIITPINPHKLSVRSVVVGRHSVKIRCRNLHGEHTPMQVMFDGKGKYCIDPEEEISASLVDVKAKFLTQGQLNFYERVSRLLV